MLGVSDAKLEWNGEERGDEREELRGESESVDTGETGMYAEHAENEQLGVVEALRENDVEFDGVRSVELELDRDATENALSEVDDDDDEADDEDADVALRFHSSMCTCCVETGPVGTE